MFTGIIEGTGTIHSLKMDQDKGVLVVDSRISLTDLKMGESVAVDGCCLTVVNCDGTKLSFDISDETLRQTTLKKFKEGTIVNLERAMKASDRFGGHFVLGHVDGTGTIKEIQRNEGSLELEITYPKNLAPYLIDKGSVTVDGISLTACLSKNGHFKAYIVPHTEKLTNLSTKKAGDLVNLEGDVVGKYVERLILLGKK